MRSAEEQPNAALCFDHTRDLFSDIKVATSLQTSICSVSVSANKSTIKMKTQVSQYDSFVKKLQQEAFNSTLCSPIKKYDSPATRTKKLILKLVKRSVKKVSKLKLDVSNITIDAKKQQTFNKSNETSIGSKIISDQYQNYMLKESKPSRRLSSGSGSLRRRKAFNPYEDFEVLSVL